MGKTIRNYNNDGLKSIKNKSHKGKKPKRQFRVEDYLDDYELDEEVENQSNDDEYPHDN